MESMETTATATAAACEIARLPEELLLEVLSLTSPRDASRAAAVSLAFRAAADSDEVWSRFLPRDLPLLAKRELSSPLPASKKGLFLRLAAGPLFLQHKRVSMWLDKETGGKCYMISARALQIAWDKTPLHRIRGRWWPVADSRFKECADFSCISWLEIRAKIPSKMLSQNSSYAAYLVFKMHDSRPYLRRFPLQEASVIIGGTTTTRLVTVVERRLKRRNPRVVPIGEDVIRPEKRADSWMELELGEFYNEKGDDGEVCISLTDTEEIMYRGGLVVLGIEIRPKRPLPLHSLLTTSQSCRDEIFIADFISMWSDSETGCKCYMLTAKALQITWIDLVQRWGWMPLTANSRFSEFAELHGNICWLEITGKIDIKMLTGNIIYAAYLLFEIEESSNGLDSVHEASVTVGGSKSTRQVCLDSYNCKHEDDVDQDEIKVVPRRVFPQSVAFPCERADGWMELELGEFCHENADDGEVCIHLMETTRKKTGLIVQGIEIRPKNSG